MAINLETLSPTELKSLIANAQSQMQSAHLNHVKEVREKIVAQIPTGPDLDRARQAWRVACLAVVCRAVGENGRDD